MSVTCWHCDVRPLEDPDLFSWGMAALPWDDRRESVMRFRFDRDRRLSLGAGLLLAHALREAGATDLTLSFNAYGKPALERCPDIQFNLSHSTWMAVCAVSDEAVGVDVEVPCRGYADLIGMCLGEDERAWVQGSDDPERAFTRLWTRKESYLKRLGLGLVDDLAAVSVLPGRPLPDGSDFAESEEAGYQICVCTRRVGDVVVRPWQLTPGK